MKILLLLAITLVFSCKSVDEGSYLDVVGGIATEDFPGIMGMKIYDPQSSYDEVCTVTLVEDKIFLTAAHCLVKTPQFKFEIFTGTDIFSRSKKGKMLEIEEYLIHPQFSLNNFQAGFDFALVKVTQSVGVPPIAFSTGKNRSFSELELVGFGFEGPYDRELSGIKRKVLLPVKRFDILAPGSHHPLEQSPNFLDFGADKRERDVTIRPVRQAGP